MSRFSGVHGTAVWGLTPPADCFSQAMEQLPPPFEPARGETGGQVVPNVTATLAR